MSRKRNLLATISAFAVMASATSAAAADPIGVAAGTPIENRVTVNYSVNGVNQADVQASDTFTVDRKLNVTVTWQDASAVSAAPGQESVVTEFLVTNLSNATVDFLLTAEQATGDAFNSSDVKIYIDTNNDGVFDGNDSEASSIGDLGSGDAVTVFVVADMIDTGPPQVIPTNGQQSDIYLFARFADGVTNGTAVVQGAETLGYVGTGGTAIATDDSLAADVRTGNAQNVFADAAVTATGDGLRDGRHSAVGSYIISGANVTATKVSTVVADGLGNVAPNAKAIPGATVEYCIVVAHSGGTATAESITISDTIPTGLTWLAGSTVSVHGPVAVADNACTAGLAAGFSGSHLNGVVSGTLPNLTSGYEAALVFRATINAN